MPSCCVAFSVLIWKCTSCELSLLYWHTHRTPASSLHALFVRCRTRAEWTGNFQKSWITCANYVTSPVNTQTLYVLSGSSVMIRFGEHLRKRFADLDMLSTAHSHAHTHTPTQTHRHICKWKMLLKITPLLQLHTQQYIRLCSMLYTHSMCILSWLSHISHVYHQRCGFGSEVERVVL